MNFQSYPDRDMLMIALADRIASNLSSTLQVQERASIAVPGGTTPGPIFDILSGADLHWDRIDVMLTDERWLPETSDRSNTRLLRERLLVDRAAAARLLPMHADADQPEAALDGLAAAIAPALPLSVLLLGMGADMHTASIFPGADRLDDALAADAPILMPMRAPGAPEPRITLTAPVLTGAMHIHILITGAEKRAALDRARHLSPAQAPVAVVLGQATVHWAE